MATDFFQRQDTARRQTARLVALFVASVGAIIATIYLAIVLLVGGANHGLDRLRPADLWDPTVFLWVAGGTSLIVLFGGAFKFSELAGGGEPIAMMLGGRVINPHTTDPAERRLQNVVEEMSLASGVPVPPVFVLDEEPGINAFAAGHLPSNAVVAVSRGCLERLTRDELQGVVGHEFSHILNGDMRLNLRLIAVVHGILVLAMVGYFAMRVASSVSSSRGSKDKNGADAAIFVLGLVLYLFGFLGVFFGKLIKSAISRQREFLADAASVQFTRNPSGIAGALKKIAGFTEGSRIRSPRGEEISHMFFCGISEAWFANLFATHPPILERIRRLDPAFRGELESPEVVPAEAAKSEAPVSALAGAVPSQLTATARDPMDAQSLIFAMLLDSQNAAVHQRQLELIHGAAPMFYDQTLRAAEGLASTPREARLNLLDLAAPALKRMSAQQYSGFRALVEQLAAADGKIDLFEYSLRMVLFTYLDVFFGQRKSPMARFRTAYSVSQPLAVVLSRMAYSGSNDAGIIQQSFSAGASSLGLPLELLPPDACGLAAFDAAVGQLAQATRPVKESAVRAAATCVTADGQTTFSEDSLVRALRAAIDCPAVQ